jgi:hypothetical protein
MITRRQALTGAATTALVTATESLAMTGKDLLITNARVTTLDRENPVAQAVAIRDGRFLAVGGEQEVRAVAAPDAQLIDAKGRRLIPGLIDSHIHVIRGGLNYNMELRWEGVPTLADAMAMLKRQAENTPPPQWVRVVGGFTEHQFVEKRLPTIEEINAAAPDTPVFILHLYDRALLNAAALRAVGYDRNTPNPPGARSSVMRRATRPGCCWPSPMRRSFTRPWPRGRSCRPNISSTPPAISCAS